MPTNIYSFAANWQQSTELQKADGQWWSWFIAIFRCDWHFCFDLHLEETLLFNLQQARNKCVIVSTTIKRKPCKWLSQAIFTSDVSVKGKTSKKTTLTFVKVDLTSLFSVLFFTLMNHDKNLAFYTIQFNSIHFITPNYS